VTWLRLTENDNDPSRFWEAYIHAVAKVHEDVAKACSGFTLPPNDSDKMGEYLSILNRCFKSTGTYVFVMDDVHKITDRDVLYFIDSLIHARFKKTGR
jgi:ATP/maltotriose-dependent transcriptional regulator MalT